MTELNDFSYDDLKKEVGRRQQIEARRNAIKLYSSLEDPDLEGNWECLGCDKLVRDLNNLLVENEIVICFECAKYIGRLLND